MGMVFTLVKFSGAKCQQYINDPETFEEDSEDFLSEENDDTISLDKAWEAIHYILTGQTIGKGEGQLSKAVCSDQFFDVEQDLGMGPASYLKPDQVKEVNAALEKIDEVYLKEHFKPAEMSKEGVYPGGWEVDPDDQLEYITENFKKLQNFYREAANSNFAIASIAS